MNFFTLKVKDKIKETHDASSLVFEIPMGLEKAFRFKAGQFISLELKLNGQKLVRSYSLSSAPGDDQLRITVKKLENGQVSTQLVDHIQVGDSIEVSTPLGQFISQLDKPQDSQLFFAAGSGIGPIFSMIKDILKNTENSVSLLYSSRNEDSIILEDEINQLAQEYSGRFKLTHILSQPKNSCSEVTGRIDGDKTQDFLKEHKPQNTQVYMCGPDGLMECINGVLKKLNFKTENIHQESFTPSNESPEGYIGKAEYTVATPETLIVELNKETIELKADPNKTIIDSLLDEGFDPPYSCMGGHCMACLAKVEEGLVLQEDLGILTEENIENHENLTCQAKPASKKVKIVFDNLF